MQKLLLLLLIGALALAAFKPRTTFPVDGIITDQSGQPVVGATVTEKGVSNSVVTDTAGHFLLHVKSERSQLVISSVGFETKTVKIKPGHSLAIKLDLSEHKLEEVVVAALGVANESPMLVGKVAGITVSPNRKQRRNLPYTPTKDFNTEDYDGIQENSFHKTTDDPLSTFSIDVDAASYSNVRRFLNNGQLPATGAVRVEEMINYFHYDYPQPKNEDPFSINTEMTDCPWNSSHKLIMIGLQGRKIPMENLPPSNLVFLIDVSGSMQDANKLPLVKSSLKLLVEQLRTTDRVSMVVYAGNAGLVLNGAHGNEKRKILDAIDRLEAGGSTAGGAGIELAYKTAADNFLEQGNNRVILCTDGDFNVGSSSDAELEKLIETKRSGGVYLTVLGYGMGNYKDNKMQKLADKGNGNHAYIDGEQEARKVLVHEFGGTLFTIAKDVKLQLEFNPSTVQAYRLIGYENRLLNKEDFNDDVKDAGELGSGHTVTALYEVIPVGVKNEFVKSVDPLKYSVSQAPRNISSELLTVKFRYKDPKADKSKLLQQVVLNQSSGFDKASNNLRFAASVAEFGMLLTGSAFKQQASYKQVLANAKSSVGNDPEGLRAEFIRLVETARRLTNRDPHEEDDLVSSDDE